jgi:hypothetical protein
VRSHVNPFERDRDRMRLEGERAIDRLQRLLGRVDEVDDLEFIEHFRAGGLGGLFEERIDMFGDPRHDFMPHRMVANVGGAQPDINLFDNGLYI